MPPMGAEWCGDRVRARCEAPGCTARGKRRGRDISDSSAGDPPELRDRLCVCEFHYRAIADGLVG